MDGKLAGPRSTLVQHNNDLGHIHDRCHSIKPNDEVANALLVAHLVRETLNGLSRCINGENYQRDGSLHKELGDAWEQLTNRVLRPLLRDEKIWAGRSERKELEDGVDAITTIVELLLKKRDTNRDRVARALTRHLGKRIDKDHVYVTTWHTITKRSTGIAHFQGPDKGIPGIEQGQRLLDELDELLTELSVQPSDALKEVDKILEAFDGD